jgi:hypothetical protein
MAKSRQEAIDAFIAQAQSVAVELDDLNAAWDDLNMSGASDLNEQLAVNFPFNLSLDETAADFNLWVLGLIDKLA